MFGRDFCTVVIASRESSWICCGLPQYRGKTGRDTQQLIGLASSLWRALSRPHPGSVRVSLPHPAVIADVPATLADRS